MEGGAIRNFKYPVRSKPVPWPLTFYTQPHSKRPSHGARFAYDTYTQPLCLTYAGGGINNKKFTANCITIILH